MRRRGTGSGSVYKPTFKAKDGTRKKYPRWWIAWTEGGKRHYEDSGCTLKDDAAQVLRKKLAARDAGKRAAKGVPLSMRNLTDMVVADYEANGRKTAKRQEQCATHLCRVLGETTHASAVDEATITAYIARRRQEGAATATVNRELSTLKRGFRLALRSHRLERRPDFSLLTERNARQGFLEDHHYLAVLRHLSEDERPVVEVAYHTGWRVPSEILTRQRRHLDLAEGWLRLEPEETKNRKGRMFPLTPELRAVLEAQGARVEALERKLGRVIPWLFPRSYDGRRVNRLTTWKEACRKAGCPGRLLHDFRRTAVRNMERAGVARSVGKAMSGHLTDSVYSRYAIVDEAMLKQGAELMAKRKKGGR
jgi:site-specific recombinase XerD